MLLRGPARTIDTLLAARRHGRRAWTMLPGDLMGRAVMRGLGISEPTRVVDAGDVTAHVIEDPRVDRWFKLSAMPITAQTFGSYVFARSRLDDAILAHECEHIRQYRRFGPFYLPLYMGSSAAAFLRRRKPYWDNHFEIAARRREGEAREWERRQS